MTYKVVGHMTALNGMQFLPQVVEAVSQCVDLLLIVESSVPQLQYTCTKEGLSTDGTTEYLKQINTRDNIQCFHLGEVEDLIITRNLMIRNTPKDADFIMKLDSDEAFFYQEYKLSLKHLPPNTIGMTNHFHFWKDTKHIITSRKESHWTNYKPRFIPMQRGLGYKIHDDFTNTYLEKAKCKLPLRVYHFSWMAHPDKVKSRLIWHNMKNEGLTTHKPAESHALNHFYFTSDYTKSIYTMDQDIGIEIKDFTGRLPIQV